MQEKGKTINSLNLQLDQLEPVQLTELKINNNWKQEKKWQKLKFQADTNILEGTTKQLKFITDHKLFFYQKSINL